ncbi:MAG TPA: DUF3240 family protein [Methylovorus sp.]|nr:DUF3240 family protein [Methylovorus sp.]
MQATPATSALTTLAVLEVTVQPDHEDPMVDFLMSRLPGIRFSRYQINLHGQPENGLSLREQVLGSTRRSVFSVQAESALLMEVAADLQQGAVAFPLQYRVLPLLQAGEYLPR